MKESFEASVVHRSSCGITGVAGLQRLLRQKLEKQKMPARKHDAHPERQLALTGKLGWSHWRHVRSRLQIAPMPFLIRLSNI